MKLAEKMNEIYKKSLTKVLNKRYDEVIKAIETAAELGMDHTYYSCDSYVVLRHIFKAIIDEGFSVNEDGLVLEIKWESPR